MTPTRLVKEATMETTTGNLINLDKITITYRPHGSAKFRPMARYHYTEEHKTRAIEYAKTQWNNGTKMPGAAIRVVHGRMCLFDSRKD